MHDHLANIYKSQATKAKLIHACKTHDQESKRKPNSRGGNHPSCDEEQQAHFFTLDFQHPFPYLFFTLSIVFKDVHHLWSRT